MTMSTPIGAQDMTGHFETSGTALSGHLMSAEGQQDLTGTIEGSKLRFELKVEKPMKITLKYDLQVDGDAIFGKVKMGMFGSSKLTGQRI
jgi:carbon-monoxide dehydrogenase large subunit